jgi:high frequency lysogenization protein
VSKNWNDMAIALAGVFQAAALVEQLAKTGFVPSDAQNASVSSLFKLNPDSTADVFGNDLKDIELGLKVMSDLLSNKSNPEYPDTLRYVLGILHLQKKLHGRPDLQDIIANRLQKTQHQVEHFGIGHENVLGNIADIYSDTISIFKFRIQVVGDYSYLQQNRVANQIRALLFAGIRAATLWRQVGGNRFRVIVNRKRLSSVADTLLAELNA